MNFAARVARVERILRKQGPWVLAGSGFQCIDCGVAKDPGTADPEHVEGCLFHPDDASIMEVPGPRFQDARLDQYLPLLEEVLEHRRLRAEFEAEESAAQEADRLKLAASKEVLSSRVGHEGATAEDPNKFQTKEVLSEQGEAKPAEVIPETGVSDPDKQTEAHDTSESQS